MNQKGKIVSYGILAALLLAAVVTSKQSDQPEPVQPKAAAERTLPLSPYSGAAEYKTKPGGATHQEPVADELLVDTTPVGEVTPYTCEPDEPAACEQYYVVKRKKFGYKRGTCVFYRWNYNLIPASELTVGDIIFTVYKPGWTPPMGASKSYMYCGRCPDCKNNCKVRRCAKYTCDCHH
jgi:hypothetical protein